MKRTARALLALLLGATPALAQQIGADWPMYSHDLGGTRYSPLAESTSR